MHMKLGDIELITRIDQSGVVKEIRSVHNISVSGKRRIVELQIPGSKSNVFQDMGRDPLRISFDGELVGPNAKKTLQDIKAKFELKEPTSYSADFAPLNDITEVVIESLTIHFVGGIPDGHRYSMVVREHKSSSTSTKKPTGETEPPSLDSSAKKDMDEKIGEIFKGVNSKS